MRSHFTISQTGSLNDRPPISYKIRQYFENFIVERVLMEKKIIINGQWHINLTIHFIADGDRGPKSIFLAKGARTVTEEKVKVYEILIPVKLAQDVQNPLLRIVELIYDAIKIFLTATYKKVKPEFMDDLWKKVDLDYLLALPYPASFEEQKYLLDNQLYEEQNDGEIREIDVQEQANRIGYKGKV